MALDRDLRDARGLQVKGEGSVQGGDLRFVGKNLLQDIKIRSKRHCSVSVV